MKQTLKRRICAAILCHILLLGLAGCGKANKAKPSTSQANRQGTTQRVRERPRRFSFRSFSPYNGEAAEERAGTERRTKVAIA